MKVRLSVDRPSELEPCYRSNSELALLYPACFVMVSLVDFDARKIFKKPQPGKPRPRGRNLELVYIQTRLELRTCEKEFEGLDLWWRWRVLTARFRGGDGM